MANKEAKQYFNAYVIRKKHRRNKYPSLFYLDKDSQVHSVLGLKPILFFGNKARKRENRDYLNPYFFFNSFKSIKTVSWLMASRPDIVRARQDRYYTHPFVFRNIKIIPNTSALLWFASRPNKAVHSRSEKYIKSKYPSVFSKYTSAGFTIDVPDKWSEVPDQTTTWTKVDQ
jgi:hypothetical protein